MRVIIEDMEGESDGLARWRKSHTKMERDVHKKGDSVKKE